MNLRGRRVLVLVILVIASLFGGLAGIRAQSEKVLVVGQAELTDSLDPCRSNVRNSLETKYRKRNRGAGFPQHEIDHARASSRRYLSA